MVGRDSPHYSFIHSSDTSPTPLPDHALGGTQSNDQASVPLTARKVQGEESRLLDRCLVCSSLAPQSGYGPSACSIAAEIHHKLGPNWCPPPLESRCPALWGIPHSPAPTTPHNSWPKTH